MKEFEQLAQEYQKINIPDGLELFVKKTIAGEERRMRRNQLIKYTLSSIAALVIIFIGTVNLSPAAVNAMSKIPVVKSLVRVVTFRELVYQDDTHKADVKVPRIEGLANSDLADALNREYLERNTELYNRFLAGIGESEITPQVLALYTNYKIKTNTDNLLTVESITTEIAASGKETVHYDNIDTKNQIIITLPSLFKGDSYVDVISANIITQMRELMKADIGNMYFIEADGDIGGFSKIKPEQSFYINAEAKLVIVFDEYDVAPGSMGIVEFTIPTEVIQKELVSNAYIK